MLNFTKQLITLATICISVAYAQRQNNTNPGLGLAFTETGLLELKDMIAPFVKERL